MVRNFLIIPLVLVLAAQKPVKKPDVHPDFQFGSYPWSRTAEALMKDDLTREVVVAYSQGWSIDKMAKTAQSLDRRRFESLRQARGRETHGPSR